VQWCEVLFHNKINLRTAWPLLVLRRPWVIAHHTWISVPAVIIGNPYRKTFFLVIRLRPWIAI
jgi:hypothetical protein